MKKVSLLEVSAFVVVAVVASATVSADDKMIDEQVKKAGDIVEPKVLFAPLDADKNGLISMQELGAGNELLKKQFNQIDVNDDKGISEQELKNYLANVEVKVNI